MKKKKVKLLKEIVDRTGAEIVLSSDWRYWLNTDDEDIILLERELGKTDLDIMSSTPITSHGYRGAEIHQWLNKWTGEAVERFVILDDNIDMKPYMDRLVETDFKRGLCRKDVERAVEVLGEKDYAIDIKNRITEDLLYGVKPKDCKHCYGASAGVVGAHYSCDYEQSKAFGQYPLVICPKECEFYEKEE